MAGMPAIGMPNNADFIRTVLISVGSVAYNLTDHKLEMEVRNRPSSAETFISIDSDELGGIFIETPPTAGQWTFTFSAERLLRIPPGDYYYDAILVRPDGFRINLGINTMTLAQGITR